MWPPLPSLVKTILFIFYTEIICCIFPDINGERLFFRTCWCYDKHRSLLSKLHCYVFKVHKLLNCQNILLNEIACFSNLFFYSLCVDCVHLLSETIYFLRYINRYCGPSPLPTHCPCNIASPGRPSYMGFVCKTHVIFII